jgi:hypothetical protein
MPGREDRLPRFFDNAVPFAAIIALALPARGKRAALLADEFAFCLCHPELFSSSAHERGVSTFRHPEDAGMAA